MIQHLLGCCFQRSEIPVDDGPHLGIINDLVAVTQHIADVSYPAPGNLRMPCLELVRHMARIGPARLVYISCHPATLARDAAILTGTEGYRLDAAGTIDMFPHTAHVEGIAVFSKSSSGSGTW